ncbi:Uncharacterized protein FWK35_00022340, partial [Aphis craccivora]
EHRDISFKTENVLAYTNSNFENLFKKIFDKINKEENNFVTKGSGWSLYSIDALIGHFYRNIICDEQTCVNYLKSKQLLPQNEENYLTCNKLREGVSCGGDL